MRTAGINCFLWCRHFLCPTPALDATGSRGYQKGIMSKYAVLYGSLLIVIGITGYVATGRESVTALIPSFLGILMAGLGAAGLAKEEMRKHLMHAALVVALIGFGGTVRALPDMFGIVRGVEVEVAEDPAEADAALETERVRRWIVFSKSATAFICFAFLAQGVRSFAAARMK